MAKKRGNHGIVRRVFPGWCEETEIPDRSPPSSLTPAFGWYNCRGISLSSMGCWIRQHPLPALSLRATTGPPPAVALAGELLLCPQDVAHRRLPTGAPGIHMTRESKQADLILRRCASRGRGLYQQQSDKKQPAKSGPKKQHFLAKPDTGGVVGGIAEGWPDYGIGVTKDGGRRPWPAVRPAPCSTSWLRAAICGPTGRRETPAPPTKCTQPQDSIVHRIVHCWPDTRFQQGRDTQISPKKKRGQEQRPGNIKKRIFEKHAIMSLTPGSESEFFREGSGQGQRAGPFLG